MSEPNAASPIDRLLEWLPQCDFAVLAHGFAPHGRDYFMQIQDCLGPDPGEHLVEFTHVVFQELTTRVPPSGWLEAWDDVFCDYQRWLDAGQPGGYVWGTNWSNAYPGLNVVTPSPIAEDWGVKLGQSMHEVAVETDRFRLRLVFHDIRHRKLSNDASTISAVTFRLRPSIP